MSESAWQSFDNFPTLQAAWYLVCYVRSLGYEPRAISVDFDEYKSNPRGVGLEEAGDGGEILTRRDPNGSIVVTLSVTHASRTYSVEVGRIWLERNSVVARWDALIHHWKRGEIQLSDVVAMLHTHNGKRLKAARYQIRKELKERGFPLPITNGSEVV